jgi:hypothetical protein
MYHDKRDEAPADLGRSPKFWSLLHDDPGVDIDADVAEDEDVGPDIEHLSPASFPRDAPTSAMTVSAVDGIRGRE